MKKKLKALLLKLICVSLSGCWSVFITQIFSNLPVHLNAIDKAIEFYSKTYEKVSIAGEFDALVSDVKLDTFCSIWNLKNLGKEPTCFKNANNPSCIDLFLTALLEDSKKLRCLKLDYLAFIDC